MAEFNAMDTAAFKGVWVFCEQREGQVQAISYQLLSEGRKLANGEFTGVKLIAAYHKAKGRNRKKMLIPDAAHGTNPASAALAGFETVNIESRDGMVDPDALAAAIAEHGEDVAGLMMTCPNTLGLMELYLPRIVEELRKVDALLYYDGANKIGRAHV